MREFKGGGTRDNNEGKNDYEGFISPLVIQSYGNYMNKHRLQTDGKLRDSDNWQNHFGEDHFKICMKSLLRHLFVLWFLHRCFKRIDEKDGHEINKEEALCAIKFNTNAYLDKLLKDEKSSIELYKVSKKALDDITDDETDEEIIRKLKACPKLLEKLDKILNKDKKINSKDCLMTPKELFTTIKEVQEGMVKENEGEYHVGQEFKCIKGLYEGEIYLLCCIENDKVVLIDNELGIRWRNSVEVKNVNSITYEEMDKIIGMEFKQKFELVNKENYGKYYVGQEFKCIKGSFKDNRFIISNLFGGEVVFTNMDTFSMGSIIKVKDVNKITYGEMQEITSKLDFLEFYEPTKKIK